MAETGLNINLSNFGNLITTVQSFGTRYNPPTGSLLLLPALQTLLAANQTAISNVGDTEAALTIITNRRQEIFAPLDTLSRRIVKAAAVAGASDREIADLEEIIRKIQGERAGTKNPAPVNPDDPKSISVSQQSFVNLAAHLERLLTLLRNLNEVEYNPNEEDLKMPELLALHADMVRKNNEAFTAQVAYKSALSTRNLKMYGEKTGLVDVAASVKDYVFSSSAQGAKNPDYIAIKGITFTRYKP